MNEGPLITVAIRSYMRLEALIELVERCQRQDYPRFEILVIEQSESMREGYRERLDQLARDPRVRLLTYPKLGYIGARNEAIRRSRGEVILFMDDDDLPVGDDWISRHAANYRDPLCVAVTGREVGSEDEDPAPHDTLLNRRLCLSYSPLLKLPIACNRHSQRIEGVQAIKGGGTSIRRSVIDRVGLWDEEHDGISHEEQYFDFKFHQLRRPGEYYVYDPTAVIWRRKDISGGMDRRALPVDKVLSEELHYSHKIIRRFFPVRFAALYPAFLTMHAIRTVLWFRQEQPETPLPEVLRDLAITFVPSVIKAWKR